MVAAVPAAAVSARGVIAKPDDRLMLLWHEDAPMTSERVRENGGVVEADKIVLRNRAGQVRARLECDPEGNPLLQMMAADGRPRLVAGVRGDVAGLWLFDGAGALRLDLSLDEGRDTAVLRLPGAGGTERVVVGCAGGMGQLHLYNAAGLPGVLAGAGDGGGSLLVFGAQGLPAVVLDVPDGETGQVGLSNAAGGMLVLQVGPDGLPQVLGGDGTDPFGPGAGGPTAGAGADRGDGARAGPGEPCQN
jgi:hypothetical protein